MDKNLAREKKKRLIITFETTTAPLKLDIKGKACGIPGRTIPLPSAHIGGLWAGMASRAFRQGVPHSLYEGAGHQVGSDV